MATSMKFTPDSLGCDDFSQFEDTLKQMRLLDDRIVNALNTSIPTSSFADKINASAQCKNLYDMIQVAHRNREDSIKKCIKNVWTEVVDLKKQHDSDVNNVGLLQRLRKEQTKLKMMQSELLVEEIVRDQTLKVFHERCRNHYKPPAQNS